MNVKLPAMVILIAVVVIQASVGDLTSVFGVRPSLTLVAVYALAITAGEGRGLLYGAVGGFVEDCLSGGLLGVYLSSYALVGYLAGRIGKRVFNIGEAANFAGIFLLSMAQGLYTAVVLNTFVDGYDIVGGVLRSALPLALYNAVAGTLALWVFKKSMYSRVPWLKTIRHIKVQP